MKKATTSVVAAAICALAASPAWGHVTIQPSEATIGSFSRFVVRVPTEEADASTIKVQIQFPPLAFVGFESKDGWQRSVKEGKFKEPLEAFGQKITKGVKSVTWSGGSIAPSEFAEFGFSAKMPDEESSLTFKAVQTYDSGKVVKWTGAPDSETPAPGLAVLDIGAEEGEGQLAVLAHTHEKVDALQEASGTEPEPVESETSEEDAQAAPEDEDDDDSDEGKATLGVGLGAGGLLLGLVALIVALKGRKA